MGTPHDEKEGGLLTSVNAALGIALICIGVGYVAGQPRVLADSLQTSITISICGNGIVDQGETCDDGFGHNVGSYGSTTAQRVCSPDCNSFGPYCGDGVLQVRFSEQCDQGASNGGSSLCSITCMPVPAVPPTSPATVVGNTPFNPNAPPGVIPSVTQTQVVLHGKAYPNTDVNVLLDGKPLAVVRSDNNADFLFNSTAVPAGTATFSFWAKDSTGVASLTTSAVFEVVQSAITSVNNIFIPPTLSLSDQKIAPGGLLTLFGQSVPTARVITNLDTDKSSTFAALADQSGKWVLQLDTGSIAAGFHSAKVSFQLSTTSKSGFGKSVSFFVGNQLPAGGTSTDLNGDGKVNLVDFSIFLLSWNTHDIRSDFNQDGTVNLGDFSILLFNWTG